MTAKEQLRNAIDGLSEAEAADALDYLVRRRGEGDALNELLERAPVDDEPISEDEERAVQVAREEIERGETVSLEQARGELR
jgi:hypothetical protein